MTEQTKESIERSSAARQADPQLMGAVILEAFSGSIRREETNMSNYTSDYQPIYPDSEALDAATSELRTTQPVTSAVDIESLKGSFSLIATQKIEQPIVIAGPCAERVQLGEAINNLVADYIKLDQAVRDSNIEDPKIIQRNRGKSAKPRSSETEETVSENGEIIEVPSYYGDMINGHRIDERTPDPSRMVATAAQARDVEKYLKARLGYHAPAAHEALLLPYEESFIREDASGKKYLLSADLPWIGERTNDPNSKQVELLAQVENPTGIKLGPSATAEQIEKLTEKLNPQQEAGKLVFMLRLGVDKLNAAPAIISAIIKYAPGSIILSDPMHGNTKKLEDGKKTRLVSDIIKEVNVVGRVCKARGLQLHGIHLEASGKDDRKECIDRPDEEPIHQSLVDPELNNEQLIRVLNETRKCFT